MKHSCHPLRHLAALSCVVYSAVVFAYQPLPELYDGSMMPYDFSRCEPAEVPDSLKPFFITYLARHGARYLSSEKKVTVLSEALKKAREANSLTPLGEELEQLIKDVTDVTAGRWGALDSVGVFEQQRLGRQMAEMWPAITGEGTISAKATYVPRVVLSMYEFAHSLCIERPQLDIFTAEGHKFDSLLRFFTTNPAYVEYLKEKPWKKEYDAFVASRVSPHPAEALFGKLFSEKENRSLTLDLYALLQSLRAAGLPAPDTRWMTETDYRACWEASNLEHYFARTINPLSTIPAEGAKVLLKNMLSKLTEATANIKTDNSVTKQDTEKAVLYFGHAETLMPILSLCNVEGCNAPQAKIDNVAKEWKDYEVVPLGANFEIVLLSSPSDNVFALTRLNGRNVKIGPFPSAIVKWESLLSYLNSRISLY